MHWAECDKYIFTFFAGDLMVFCLDFFSWRFRKKPEQLQPCILTNMTAAPPRRFTHRGKRSYTSEADWLFLRDMTVKKVGGWGGPHCYFGRGAWHYECNNLYSFSSENRKAG